MTQLGESVNVALVTPKKEKFVVGAILEIRFESEIKLWELVNKQGTAKELPRPGAPHWGRGKRTFPAVYVREGGQGGVDTLKVKVKWAQKECDGKATIEGTYADVTITGEFSMNGPTGETIVDCKFTKRPQVVMNYGRGIPIAWQIEAGAETGPLTGGSPLKLYFVEQKPKVIGWEGENESFYLPIVEWATKWAEGTRGEKQVLDALWDKFSDGKQARVPHMTGFEYWKTTITRTSPGPVQNLKELLCPGTDAPTRGWSCRAIAHVFMECLALHGIKCTEVIPQTPGNTIMFLVQNWRADPKPRPNLPEHPDVYYGGSWVDSSAPPHRRSVPTSLRNSKGELLVVDMLKMPGVPAQGQRDAPLGFSNHWIVEVSGKLYDTSYGMTHNSTSLDVYRDGALAGWLIALEDDVVPGSSPEESSMAWFCHELKKHSLAGGNARHN